jgi:hypothetical protein
VWPHLGSGEMETITGMTLLLVYKDIEAAHDWIG